MVNVPRVLIDDAHIHAEDFTECMHHFHHQLTKALWDVHSLSCSLVHRVCNVDVDHRQSNRLNASCDQLILTVHEGEPLARGCIPKQLLMRIVVCAHQGIVVVP